MRPAPRRRRGDDAGQRAWSLELSIAAFVAAALVIGVAGVLLTARAERLAVVTGLGELLTGAVLIGAVTSLSGLVTSITAAYGGHASLAVSNSLGGIAAQTVFLAIADMAYRRANLEHAAASEANLLQGAVRRMPTNRSTAIRSSTFTNSRCQTPSRRC